MPTHPGTPYLAALGAPALRFREATPPPDLVTRPPAAAPPEPALSPTENSVAVDNAAAARSVAVATPPTETPAAEPAGPAKDAPPQPKTPPPILRDETRPAVRAEDFLPYFQIPGGARQPGEATIIAPVPISAPAPGQLPPSSATYIQTK